MSNQNKQLVSGTVKEIGQVGGDSVSGLGVKAKNIRRPTSANEVVCEECCCSPSFFYFWLDDVVMDRLTVFGSGKFH